LKKEVFEVEPKITLTREELYEKVWTTPMQKLAAEFGFSDRGLAKLCGRHQVPTPPRGYWARLRAGQSVKRTPLAPVTDISLKTVEIYPHEKRPMDQLDEMEEQEIPLVTVAGDGPLTHPISLQIEKCLSRPMADDRGMLLPKPGTAVPIRVSFEQLPRALRICDALLQAMEQAQYQGTWPKPYNAPLTVTVLGEPLTFLISEAVNRKEHQIAKPREKLDPWWAQPRWDYEPPGRLRLAIECSDYLGVRRRWWTERRRGGLKTLLAASLFPWR
jgi:hypothetical protein